MSRTTALGAAALGLMVLVSYLPALWAGFVWDDAIFVEEPVIHDWSGLWSVWFDPANIKKEGHYWPIVYTSFWLEHKLWGLAPMGYHLVNVLLHLANCLLVWRLLSRLAVPGAWAVAAVFAVHPLHVESVAWIMERKDLLSTLFYVTALLTWIRFTEVPEWRRYCLALALFAAGLLSKSVVVTLPAALVIWHWWQRDKVTFTDLARLAPFFVVGLFITAGDLAFYNSREPLSLDYTFAERLLIACRALWFYVGKLLWPADLAVIYPLWDIRAGDLLAWAYVLAAGALPVLLWLGLGRIGRGPLVGALFFALTLSPVLGFVDYGYMQFAFVADRFQYLAGLGVMAVLVGAGVTAAGRLTGAPRAAVQGAFGAVLVVLGALTWAQSGVYRNEVALFGHIAASNPEARDAHLNLAKALILEGRNEEALAAARVAVAQRPDFVAGYTNLGLSLLNLKRYDEAEKVLRQGMQHEPRDRNSRQNLADTLRRQGRYKEAVEAYRDVIEVDRRYALAYAGLGDTLFRLTRYEDAVSALERALALDPDASVAVTLHLILGESLTKLNRFDAAAERFRRAAAMDPGDARPLGRLAQLLNTQGRTAEADGYLRRLRELRPDQAASHHHAAEVLRRGKRYEDAVASYRAALQVDPDYGPAHAGLGTALFAMKRYDEALESLERSIDLEPESLAVVARHVLAGRAARALDRTEEAIGHFERAHAMNPRNASALDFLGVARFSQKRYDEALTLFRALLELRPDQANILANIGTTLYHLGRPEEALPHFERAAALKPDLASAQAGLQAARRALERTGQAQGQGHGKPEE
ncbi:MAG: tetratricopeptide repeat protein [Deltaproteobacteria bacterium]|nr:tetratricopeptide repeat protein [Deltaproteobacteria bacterium]